MMDDGQCVRLEPAVAREEEDAAPSDDEFEFEFPSVSRDNNDDGGCCGAAAPADELFAGGRVRAFYPLFGRVLSDAAPEREPLSRRAPLGRLFQLETSSVASTSSSFELDAAPADSYCLWTPGSSPASSPSRRPRKSGSTGSVARWRRIGDLVVGRSNSDGRDKFRSLSAPPSPSRERASSDTKAKKQPAGKGSNADTVAAGRRQASYSYGGAKGPRRTFLPYRQDLVGLFAGVHRGHHHPF